MQLTTILQNIEVEACYGNTKVDITSIQIDSRKVTLHSAFFAIKGEHNDGFTYISEAIKNGALVIFTDRIPSKKQRNITYIVVSNVRKILSRVAHYFYHQPSQHLPVIGITGTDGKTTTIWFAFHLLKSLNIRVGVISTVASGWNDNLRENTFHQTTPEAHTIHRTLAEMHASSCKVALLESTSHGLSHQTYRLRDVHYYAALYTPIGHEHLEFHRSFEQYLQDKKKLLTQVRPALQFSHLHHPPFLILNLTNKYTSAFLQSQKLPVYGYALQGIQNPTFHCPILFADNIKETMYHTSFTVHWGNKQRTYTIPIPNAINIENMLAAVLLSSLISEMSIFDVFDHCMTLTLPPGRMQKITAPVPFSVIVDFAHTPQAFEKILSFFHRQKKSRLIVVFGSAGERDTKKRTLQGIIAAQYADIIILTDEDPRNEDSYLIIKEIEKGIHTTSDKFCKGTNLFLIPSRKKAIKQSIQLAHPNDIVVLLGKGHENSIIYKDHVLEWNEAKIVKQILSQYKA